MIDYTKITDDIRDIELLKQLSEIEKQINMIDDSALIKYQLELLSL